MFIREKHVKVFLGMQGKPIFCIGGPDNLKAAVLNQYRSEFISIIDSIGPTNFHMVLVKGKEIDERINNFQSSFTNLQIYPSVYVYARDKQIE